MIVEKNKMQNLKVLLVLIISSCVLSCTSDHSAKSVANGRTEAQLAFLCANLDQYKVADSGLYFVISDDDKDLRKKKKSLIDGWKRPIVPIIKNGLAVGVKSFGPNGIDDNGNDDDLICSKP
jgi:hypothetical protein